MPLPDALAHIFLVVFNCQVIQFGLRLEITYTEIDAAMLEAIAENGNQSILTSAGYDYNAVQKRVNEKLYRKTVDEVAVEVIAGLWGNGSERKEKLTEAGYDYSEVQRKVNQLIK